VLQTPAPNEAYHAGELAVGEDHGQSLNLGHYIDILRRRIFYFLLPFGIVSIAGLYLAAITSPSYLSEGKILIETQRIAPDFVRPIVTATENERIQLIQQRILTRDNLLAIAAKFGLFPKQPGVLELMRLSTRIKPVDGDGQLRLGTPTIAFTVGFEYDSPETAMSVANEFITLIVDDDVRSRTSRASEAVKVLTSETKDIEDRLEATQSQLLELARRPRDTVPESPDKERSQLTALATLKAELIQKMSVYSEAHPAVTTLKKRIAAMEKMLTQLPPVSATPQSTLADDVDALKRQRDTLEKRLADANAKLAAARLSEKLDRDQQSDRLQVIESPTLPHKPVKSGRLKTVAMAFALAAALGIGAVLAIEFLDGSIHNRHQLLGVVDSDLVVSIPYLTTQSDIIRARMRKIFVALTIVTILAAWSALAAAIVFHIPVEFAQLEKSGLIGANQ
jgi:uncharacterized protein involved in exopolysaccharide biosynthesis